MSSKSINLKEEFLRKEKRSTSNKHWRGCLNKLFFNIPEHNKRKFYKTGQKTLLGKINKIQEFF